MAEDEKKEPEKKPPAQSRSTAAKKSTTTDAPREELRGVLRTSRIGAIEDRARLEDPEGERHRTLADALQPGDENYNPYTDPLIPTSTLQQTVAKELEGLGESPTWNALHDAEEMGAKRHEILRKFQEGNFAEAS